MIAEKKYYVKFLMYAMLPDDPAPPVRNGKAKFKRGSQVKSDSLELDGISRCNFLAVALIQHGLEKEYLPEFPFKLWWYGSGCVVIL